MYQPAHCFAPPPSPPASATVPLLPFDADVMRRPPLLKRLIGLIALYARPLSRLLRVARPILRLGRLVIVTRDADVREVLRRNEDFAPPFADRFRALDPAGENFILGMDDTAEYRALRDVAMHAFARADLPRIAAFAAARARTHLDAAGGEIDVARDLLRRVPLEVVAWLYGVPTDHGDFGLWIMAMSYFDFDPAPSAAERATATAASQRMAAAVRTAIAAARAAPDGDTIVGRLLAIQARQPDLLTDARLAATLTGMIAGFVPTNLMASGNMLEMLLDRPDMMAASVAAARAGDDGRLWRCLFEALRFRPINPGSFRNVVTEATIASGTRRARRLWPGDRVLAAQVSAMFDARRVADPNRFDPGRPDSDYLHFGHGQHWCIGAALAEAQITATFRTLLARGGVRRVRGPAGRAARFGPFAEHLTIAYGS